MFASTHLPRPPHLQVFGRDVTLHLCAYLILTLLYWIARHSAVKPDLKNRSIYLTFLLMAAYGAADEITQKIVGRNADIRDWFADVAGIITALVLVFCLRRWRHWLYLYWFALALITHWPGESPFIKLPGRLQQYQVLYLFVAYLALTLLFWRSLSPKGYFAMSRRIFFSCLVVLPLYALLDEAVNLLMQRGFDETDFFAGLGGIAVGIISSLSFAQHHRTQSAADAAVSVCKPPTT